jgi:uncharacterized membrane protein
MDMLDNGQILSWLGQFAMNLPTLLVCIAGSIMIYLREMPKLAKTCGIVGLLLISVQGLVGLAFQIFVTKTMIEGAAANPSQIGTVYAVYGVISHVFFAITLVLLVIAICKGREKNTRQDSPLNPY